ncbi:MAG: MerR family transcriptional regulator [Chloroflexi bacterium]|nr:MAG: MerR family transcriptional regulator [Chloroflexota bacterium]
MQVALSGKIITAVGESTQAPPGCRRLQRHSYLFTGITLRAAPDCPYTRGDFPPSGLSGKGRAVDGMKCNSPTAVASGPLEERMATAVKHETRRDTNISLDKPIYTISVASEILETHPRTLMMYEHLGLVVPKRTSTNRRRFSQRDIMKLQTIQKLTRQHSVNLAGVRYILKLLKVLYENRLVAPAELRDIDVAQLEV